MGIKERLPFGEERSIGQGLEGALQKYEVEDNMLSRPKEELLACAIATAKENLKGSKMAFKDSETAILYLSIIDQGLSEGWKISAPFFRQLNLLQQDLSHSATVFDVEDVQEETQSHVEDRNEKIHRFFDSQATMREVEYYRDWSDSSPLSQVRKFFAIQQNSEWDFSLSVLALNSNEFTKEFYCGAFAESRKGKSRICLPNDAEDETKVHEYIHAQTYSLRHKRFSLLMSGLEEAMVDNLSDGNAYLEQMWVMEMLVDANSFLLDEIAEALQTGNRTELYRMLISQYGLTGFASIARMSPSVDNDEFYSEDLKTVCLDPDIVQARIFDNKLI